MLWLPGSQEDSGDSLGAFCKDPEMLPARRLGTRVGPWLSLASRVPVPPATSVRPRLASRKQDGDRLRARQSIYSCVLVSLLLFFRLYIYLHSPPSTHGFSVAEKQWRVGRCRVVEVEEVEPDGLDST